VALALGALAAFGAAASAAAVSLPDGRAYELVSPPDKNGGDVLADSGRTRAAEDGSAVSFSSLVGFADAHGTGIATDYMSVRHGASGTSGWSTHAITPAQDALTFQETIATDPLYVGDFSDDLRVGVFRAVSPLTDAPNVAAVTNLYRRGDLRTPSAGTYQLATNCSLCELTRVPLPPLPASAPGYLVPEYAGGSADLETVAFESRFRLTSDAPTQLPQCVTFSAFFCRPILYAATHGETRLIGLVPVGTDLSCGGANPPCETAQASIAGQGAEGPGAANPNRPLHIVSADGSRIFFTVPSDAAALGGQTSGRLYVRRGNGTTDWLSASERAAADTPEPATYWSATPDGARVFFTTSEALTDDAPVDGDRKLYMYDVSSPAADPHNLTYINVDHEGAQVTNDAQGVIGSSNDGRYVYFLSSGQLVDGGPQLSLRGIFMWHDDEIAFVAAVPDVDPQELLPTGDNYRLTQTQARVTHDGRHLLLLNTDDGGFRQLYVYSADTHRVECASCRPSGNPATRSAFVALRANASVAAQTWHMNHPIAEDGKRVFFTTGDALLPADTNGKNDVYEYDVVTGSVSLISSGNDQADAFFMDASNSGDDVFFLTRQRLVGWDTDTSYDLYDARVGGGLPDPGRAPEGCANSACQGVPNALPATPRGGTDSFEGAGDVAGSLHKRKTCRKGFVKRTVRGKRKCIKRKRHQAKKHAAQRAGIRHQRRSK
jgi:Tol biopolymer transport system component